jgi:hypothetical protein
MVKIELVQRNKTIPLLKEKKRVSLPLKKDINREQLKIKPKEKKIEYDTIGLLELWTNLNLKKLPKEYTKTYQTIIKTIRKLHRGTFFSDKSGFEQYVNKRFTTEQIESSIENFALSLDPDYYPVNKEYLKNCSLSDFFYNSYHKYQKSYFLYYLENEPLKRVKDENEQLTNYIIGIYKTKVLNGTIVDMSSKTKDQFITASSLLKTFFNRNKPRIRTGVFINDLKMVQWLYESILMDVKETYKIKPGYFCSSETFSVRLPLYLDSQGIFK